MLLDGADAHDQEDDAEDGEHDLEAENLVEGCDAGSVDQRAVPGVNEHVRQEADNGKDASGGAEDSHRNAKLGERRRADGESAVGGEAEHDDQAASHDGQAGILRHHDEGAQNHDGEREAADDGLGGLSLRSDGADNRASEQANTIGTNEADDVNGVSIGAHGLRQVRSGVGSALVHAVDAEVTEASPQNAGGLDGLSSVSNAEEFGVLVDFTLEVGDEDERQNTENGNQNAQEDDDRLHSEDGVGDSSDDGSVDNANNKAGNTVDGVGNTNAGRILIFFAAQTNNLETGAPPNQDGGKAHAAEQHVAHLHGRKHRVEEREHCGADEADPRQGAHAELVGDDARRQVADKSDDAVEGHHCAQVGVGAAESRHQRIVEDALQIHRRVDDGGTHRNEDDQEPLVETSEVLVRHLALALCKNGHVFSLSRLP